jgi:hypothetical protein
MNTDDADRRPVCAINGTGVPKRQMETTVVFYNSFSNADARVIPRRDAPARTQCAQNYFFPSSSRTGVPKRQMETTVVFYSSFSNADARVIPRRDAPACAHHSYSTDPLRFSYLISLEYNNCENETKCEDFLWHYFCKFYCEHPPLNPVQVLSR